MLGSGGGPVKGQESLIVRLLCPVVQAKLEIVAQLDETARGDGGFGHTER